eukprot:scaffold1658_cov115-Isochrysis_galbana.AAC.4
MDRAPRPVAREAVEKAGSNEPRYGSSEVSTPMSSSPRYMAAIYSSVTWCEEAIPPAAGTCPLLMPRELHAAGACRPPCRPRPPLSIAAVNGRLLYHAPPPPCVSQYFI